VAQLHLQEVCQAGLLGGPGLASAVCTSREIHMCRMKIQKSFELINQLPWDDDDDDDQPATISDFNAI
jgi:hypothetical protein